MGLKTWWTNYKKNSHKDRLEKYKRKICHINTTHERRQELISYLISLKEESSTEALLKRYDLTLHEKPIMDEAEKEKVAEEIVLRGEAAIKSVKEFIGKSQNISWPLDILKEIIPEEEFVNFLINILTTEEVLFNEEVVDKRLDVLNVLVNYKNEKIYEKVVPLIDDDDDRIKILAIDILSNQINIDNTREKFLNMMINDDVSPRIRRKLIELFSEREWKLTGFKNKVETIIPFEEFYINKDGIIRKRQITE